MYFAIFLLHSWLRWAVLVAGSVAVARAIAGWRRKGPWTAADNRAGLWFTILLDVQVLLGLVLYFAFSPLPHALTRDFAAAMRDSALRFWAIEHAVGMLVAVVIVHIGRVSVRMAPEDVRRHRLGAIFFGVALIVVLASIPWPGTPYARPLLRW